MTNISYLLLQMVHGHPLLLDLPRPLLVLDRLLLLPLDAVHLSIVNLPQVYIV